MPQLVPAVSLAAVDHNGTLEGLICIGPVSDELKVYFLSTAPWNHGAERRRRGVGTALISVAVEHSLAAGFGGQIVLSSTPPSESFYAALNFVRTGQQDHEGLNIFRLAPDRAQKHLQQYPAIPLKPQPSQPGGTP
jgi:hypothetical protein